MTDLKIVFTGPPGAGKTTAITAISDRPPVVTDVRNTDPNLSKVMTTVGLDFGQVDLGAGQSVRLFGTPGQPRFEFLWKILAADALGLVILIDNTRPDPLADFALYLDAYGNLLNSLNCVAGIGRYSGGQGVSLDDFIDLLNERGLVFPVVSVDVRERSDALMLIDIVIAQAEARN